MLRYRKSLKGGEGDKKDQGLRELRAEQEVEAQL